MVAPSEIQEDQKVFCQQADTAPLMIWMSGCNALYCYFNSNWLEFTGTYLTICPSMSAREEEINNIWTCNVHPEDRQKCKNIYFKAFAVHNSFQRQYRLRRADGKYRWILDTAAPRFAADGSFVGYIGYCVDITEVTIVGSRPILAESCSASTNFSCCLRRFTEEKQAAEFTKLLDQLEAETAKRQAVEAQLRQKTSEFAAILQVLSDLYFRLDADGTILDYKQGLMQSLYISTGDCQGKSLRECLPTAVGDRFHQAITQVLETQYEVSFEYTLPLPETNNNFEARLLPLPDQQIIVLVRDTSDTVQPALIESDAKFRSIVENANNIIFALTLEGIFSYVSPNWTEIFGHEIAEVEGKSFIPFIHPDDVSICTDYFQRLLTTGEKQNAIEYRVKHKNGSWRWHTSNSSAIRDADGNVVNFVGICYDTTDRKQAESALAERARLANFRADVDAALTQSDSLDNMMRRCTEALVEHLDVAFARIWTLNKQDNVLELQVSSGMYTHINGPHKCVPVGQFKIGLIAEEGKPHLTNSVQTDPRMGNKEWAKREGMVAFAGYPLIVENETVGVIAMFARQTVTESTFTALEFAAQEIAIGIKRKQTEVALRESVQRETLLNRLSSQIRASLDLNYIVETAVQEIRNLFQIDRCAFFWYRQDADVPYWERVYEAKSSFLPCLLHHQEATNTEIELIAAKTLNREIIRINDVKTVGDSIAQQFLQDFGFTAFMSLPVHTQSGEIGAFSCGYCSGFRPWLDNEVELLQAVTVQLAIAIDQAKLYTQSRIAAQTAQDKAQQLEAALLELQQTQAQLIQTEKMSSLGQLVAGIAHEINNPVNFIYGNISHARQYTKDLLHLVELYQQSYCPPTPEIHQEISTIDLDFLKQDLPKILDSMNMGAERIRQIVLSLRNFSRLDEDGTKRVDIHEGIDSTLLLLQNRLKAKPGHPEIQVIRDYGNLPPIVCHAGQMNQVFMNLLTNAIDVLEEGVATGDWGTLGTLWGLGAMGTGNEGDEGDKGRVFPVPNDATFYPGGTLRANKAVAFPVGDALASLLRPRSWETRSTHSLPNAVSPQCPIPTIRIRTLIEEDRVIISIADNGPGMTKEVRKRLFDPFFTTKPVGKGTGMGLSISYQIIVKKHGGQIQCISAPGEGAEFIIVIPLQEQPST
ncbi:MAG: PAS domain S-box protein [Nostoc sp. ChiQUE02]|uniref:PAS domain S-box protein n=1 Tax=Nostoc sp. ChiQUE02 TaxID=3075377 RepID=UPI002AD1D09B|nr:PAS domain S-box protein [Nostoc sp. ChiQUE02]MDZ8232312.1 PAS domain S-box protein [Nostoc sp. ChiQUE02]